MSASVDVCVVTANTPDRLHSGNAVCDRLEALGHGKVRQHLDTRLDGATPAWLDAIEKSLSKASKEYLILFPDDALIADSLTPTAVERLCLAMSDNNCMFGDFAATHMSVEKAYDAGYGWYTTPDGWLGFGGVAKCDDWERLAQFVRAMEGSGLVIDELVNVLSQMHHCQILKPTISLCHQDGILPSLCGNDGQNRVMRVDPGMDTANVLSRSSKTIHLGRTYVSNHWRFLWEMTPAERQDTEYAITAYRVEKDGPVTEVVTK